MSLPSTITVDDATLTWHLDPTPEERAATLRASARATRAHVREALRTMVRVNALAKAVKS